MSFVLDVDRPYHHGRLRAALLAAAEQTVREKGVVELSLRELARDVGVSHASPGRHFKDKQTLLDALALVGFDRLTQALDAADDPRAPLQARMTGLIRAHLRFAIDNTALLELMFARKHAPDADEQIHLATDRLIEFMRRVIADAQRRGEVVDGELDRLIVLPAAAVQGMAVFVTSGALAPQDALDQVDDLMHSLMRGLAPR